MNNDYRPPACLVSFYVTRNMFTINIGLILCSTIVLPGVQVAIPDAQNSARMRSLAVYRIAGKFGGELNLAVWRYAYEPPN